MGLLRLLFGLMGMSSSPEQAKEMRQISEDDYQDLLREQQEQEWEQDTRREDDD